MRRFAAPASRFFPSSPSLDEPSSWGFRVVIMGQIAELIGAVASLLWPILGFWALLAFRSDIADLIGRLKKGKILGHQFEFDPQLRELHEVADQATSEAADLPRAIAEPDDNSASDIAHAEADGPVQMLLETAAQSPRAALLLSASEMEKEAREVLASVGKLPSGRPLRFLRVIGLLDSHYGLPKHVVQGLRLFLDQRNRLVHGRFANDPEILSALDSGLTILRALQSLPRERNWIKHAGVPIFSDEACLHELPGVKGVILRTESANGLKTSQRIFPSTKTHFQKGKRVSWEWNLDRVWPAAWYRDPESGQAKSAWSSSGEFVGRHFEDL